MTIRRLRASKSASASTPDDMCAQGWQRSGRAGLMAILAERRSSGKCMGEDEAMKMAVREQRALREESS